MQPRVSYPEDVWKEFKKDTSNVCLRNELVEHYLPIVRYHGERYASKLPCSVDVDDIISAGTIGLMDAIDAYDMSRGVKFVTYCVPRVIGSMIDEMRAMDWVPRSVRSRITKLQRAMKRFTDKHDREPSDDELAGELGVNVNELSGIKRDANIVSITALETSYYETESHRQVRLVDILKDKSGDDPSERLVRQDFWRIAMRGLSRSERLLLIMYYQEHCTMKQIGKTLDLSESRVSQMHSNLITRLKVTRAELGEGIVRRTSRDDEIKKAG